MSTVLRPTTVGHYKVGVGKTGSSSLGNRNFSGTNMSGVLGKTYSSTTATPSNGGGSIANGLDNVVTQLATSGSTYADLARSIFNYSENNSAFNADQAAIARDWSHSENLQAMKHSASEAQKTRDWQKMMSDTSYQRATKDLVAAGLNPVLALNGGASTPTGATGTAYSGGASSASADSSASAVAGLFSNVISAASQMKMQDKQLAFNALQLAQAKELGYLSSDTQLKTSQNSLLASQISASAQMAAAGTSAAASRYAADTSAATQKYISDQNNQTKKDTSLIGSMNDLFTGLGSLTGIDLYGSNFGNTTGKIIGYLYNHLTRPKHSGGSRKF
uniref:DNA pilot protein n=1 Tax=Dulem virus 120 TaxID=3145597 RepID=A0AAU8AW05_9VIRU